jgi:uncharacterized membrane protein
VRTFAAVTVAAFVTAGVILPLGSAPVGAAAPADTPTWWQVDTHQHSAFSGDARADLGVDAAKAKNAGYNAVFLTDHDRASSFQIQGTNGNYLSFTDALSSRWVQKTSGSLTSSANGPSTARVHGGTAALHVLAASTTTGRAMVYSKRGPALGAGAITLDFWAYPQQIDARSGIDVSVSLGGDTTTGTAAYGYTTAGPPPVTTLGKTTTLVWQLGAARPSSQTATAHVYSNSLSYTAAQWNHYVIDVRTGAISWTVGTSTATSSGTGLNALPAADQPVDYAVLSVPKIEASATGGTADAYVDDLLLKDSAPNCPAADFVYRNSLIRSGQFNGTNARGGQFAMFAGREMGQNNHSNQFNFDISNPSDYNDTYSDTTVPPAYGNDGQLCAATNTATAPWKFSYLGTDNIPGVQATGYPAQDNHPGITDTTANVTKTLAHGADAIEVRTVDDFTPPWDAILQQNHQVLGTYGSDVHEGVGNGAPADFIDAPSLSLNDLMRSYFEGRMYMAPNNFAGRIVFNLDGSSRPYPARYPVYVSPAATSAPVHLSITGGLTAGQTVRWVYNSGSGPTTIDDSVTGSSYDATRSIPLTGPFTYARAEIRSSAGALVANTEPIFFRSVTNLPADKSIHVDAVAAATGCGCSVAVNKGVTAASWGSSGLALTLANPAGSTVNLRGSTDDAPISVTIDGASVPGSPSLADYQSASGNAWFYDTASRGLYLQDTQSASTSSIAVGFASAPPDVAPTVPAGLAATAVSATRVDLAWAASTDTDGTDVAGYHVFRGGTLVGTTSGTTFSDTSVPGVGSYSYTVSAFDTAVPANESPQSPPQSVTTSAGATSGTFTAVADAYVVSGDAVNHGTATILRTDTSPATNSYLRFALSGLAGSVATAQLRIFANSALNAGLSVRPVTDDSWGETAIVFSTAPVYGSTGPSSGPIAAGTWITVDVTSLINTATGDANLALVGLSTTALSLGSREGANKPQLIITTK